MMKRHCAAVTKDDDYAAGIFSYPNKMKLTFNHRHVVLSSSSSSSSNEDEQDQQDGDSDVELYLSSSQKHDLDEPDVATPSRSSRVLHEFLSPSPPPLLPKTNTANSAALEMLQRLREGVQCHVADDNSPSEAESSDLPISEYMCKVKVRLYGEVRKFQLEKEEPLIRIAREIAEQENVDLHRVRLTRRNVEIDLADDTPSSINIKIVDILDCIIHDIEEVPEKKIKIKIQSDHKNSRVEYELSPHESLSRIFKEFSKKSRRGVIFNFDGDVVDGKMTPAQLDLEDGDVIDAKSK